MRILHIINDLSKNGGAQKFLVDLVTGEETKYDIKILLLCHENDYLETLSHHGIECYVWQTLTFKEKWALFRWPDIVHGHLYPSIYLALLALGKKRLQTEHSSSNRRRDYPAFKFMEYLLYLSHDLTVSISEKVQEELIKFMPNFRQKYKVINNGVDLSCFSMSARTGIKHPAQIKIGMVGRLHEHKDHEALIRAVALLPTQYQLHLAGDGQKRDALESLAQQLDITNRVFFHGVVSDIPTFLEQMDLYVQSSLIEGFGLAAVEAMAAGLPVLSSNVPGLDDVIGNASYLFEVSNSEELANKIIQVCDSNENYSVASKYSILRCKEFTIEKFRDSYYKAYDGLFIQG